MVKLPTIRFAKSLLSSILLSYSGANTAYVFIFVFIKDTLLKNSVKFNASDVAGALQLEAKRIVMAVDAFAAGAPFPSAQSIQAVIERMAELNETLIGFEREYIAMEVERKSGQPVN